MSNTDTVDISDVVSKLQSTFVTWATAYVFGVEIAIPGLEWVALPIISTIDKDLLKEVFILVANAPVMQAFFLNTAIKKASEAQDYIFAIEAKNNLSSSATKEEILNAEKLEMATFRNFVLLTN